MARATTMVAARSQKTPHPIHFNARDDCGRGSRQLTVSPNGSKCFIDGNPAMPSRLADCRLQARKGRQRCLEEKRRFLPPEADEECFFVYS
jgi:hypothetical protein